MHAKRNFPQLNWIKAKSGETYICPVEMPATASEEELAKHCVRESDNPQNN